MAMSLQGCRDALVIHSVLGICRVSHYSVLLGLGKIISPSKFNFFKVKFEQKSRYKYFVPN